LRQLSKNKEEIKAGERSHELTLWFEAHNRKCKVNFCGSFGRMKVEEVKVNWVHSFQ